ncbi:MAG: hypothetical protein AB7O26_00855 [Planctomycetaceae bacterium]
MNETLVAVLAGGLLVVLGISMIVGHRRAWDGQKNDPELAEFDRVHFYRRFRRRMQTSAMLVVLGLLLAVGGTVIPWQNYPAAAQLAYWIGVLLLTFWVILLALGDILSTRVHSRISMAQVKQKQRELELELARLKSRGSNGRNHGP